MNGKIFIAALASSLLAVNGGIFAEEKSGQKILVAYFSHSGENYGVGVVEKGNTEKLAEIIAEKTGGELFKIETKKNYSRKYRECIDEAKKELSQNARPELKKIADVSGYDTIFLGYPIWWGDLPMAVYTFLESADFSGKKIIPFCTHEGSGLSATDRKIESKCRNSSVGEALSLRGTTAQNDRAKSEREVEAWLKKNSF